MEKEKLQHVDSSDDEDDDMDVSENPSSKKLYASIGNEQTPDVNRIKQIPTSITSNTGGMIERHSVAFYPSTNFKGQSVIFNKFTNK
jgi:hypothetical protein